MNRTRTTLRAMVSAIAAGTVLWACTGRLDESPDLLLSAESPDAPIAVNASIEGIGNGTETKGSQLTSSLGDGTVVLLTCDSVEWEDGTKVTESTVVPDAFWMWGFSQATAGNAVCWAEKITMTRSGSVWQSPSQYNKRIIPVTGTSKYWALAPTDMDSYIAVQSDSKTSGYLRFAFANTGATGRFDLLVGESASYTFSNAVQSTATPTVNFRHLLSKIIINVKDADNAGWTATYVWLNNAYDYGWWKGDGTGWYDQRYSNNSGSSCYFACNTPLTTSYQQLDSGSNLLLLLPQTCPSGAQLKVRLKRAGVNYDATFSLAGQVWEPGKTYIYNMELGSALKPTLTSIDNVNFKWDGDECGAKTATVYGSNLLSSDDIAIYDAPTGGNVITGKVLGYYNMSVGSPVTNSKITVTLTPPAVNNSITDGGNDYKGNFYIGLAPKWNSSRSAKYTCNTLHRNFSIASVTPASVSWASTDLSAVKVKIKGGYFDYIHNMGYWNSKVTYSSSASSSHYTMWWDMSGITGGEGNLDGEAELYVKPKATTSTNIEETLTIFLNGTKVTCLLSHKRTPSVTAITSTSKEWAWNEAAGYTETVGGTLTATGTGLSASDFTIYNASGTNILTGTGVLVGSNTFYRMTGSNWLARIAATSESSVYAEFIPATCNTGTTVRSESLKLGLNANWSGVAPGYAQRGTLSATQRFSMPVVTAITSATYTWDADDKTTMGGTLTASGSNLTASDFAIYNASGTNILTGTPVTVGGSTFYKLTGSNWLARITATSTTSVKAEFVPAGVNNTSAEYSESLKLGLAPKWSGIATGSGIRGTLTATQRNWGMAGSSVTAIFTTYSHFSNNGAPASASVTGYNLKYLYNLSQATLTGKLTFDVYDENSGTYLIQGMSYSDFAGRTVDGLFKCTFIFAALQYTDQQMFNILIQAVADNGTGEDRKYRIYVNLNGSRSTVNFRYLTNAGGSGGGTEGGGTGGVIIITDN